MKSVVEQVAAESRPDDSVKGKSAIAVHLFEAMAEKRENETGI